MARKEYPFNWWGGHLIPRLPAKLADPISAWDKLSPQNVDSNSINNPNRSFDAVIFPSFASNLAVPYLIIPKEMFLTSSASLARRSSVRWSRCCLVEQWAQSPKT